MYVLLKLRLYTGKIDKLVPSSNYRNVSGAACINVTLILNFQNVLIQVQLIMYKVIEYADDREYKK